MILATASQILGSKARKEIGGPRIEMGRLIYAKIPGGFGLVVNLSSAGMAIQTMVALKVGQSLAVTLRLPDDEVDLSGTAEVMWCDSSGRAGLQFRGMPDGDRERLKTWLWRGDDPCPRVLGKTDLHDLGESRASALLNAEVNCLQYLAS